MVTKEQCLLKKIMDELSYGGDPKLVEYVVASYNQGKQYASDMIFVNDENGLDRGLKGFSPSFIVYSLIGENSEYNPKDPFFTINNGIRSFDGYDFERMLKPEDVAKILNEDVIEELDSYALEEAFEMFIEENYPDFYKNIYYGDYDDLFDNISYELPKSDWNQLVKQLSERVQQGPGGDLNESRVVRLEAKDLKRMTNQILREIVKNKKPRK